MLREADPLAISIMRKYLATSRSPLANEVEDLDNLALLRRMPHMVVGETEELTNAAKLLLCHSPCAIDYVFRRASGEDSLIRHDVQGPVLVQLENILNSIRLTLRMTHVRVGGGIIAQIPNLIFESCREVILNGLIHRDWHRHGSLKVEHVGNIFTVESPGALLSPVTPANIVSHPSRSRNPALAQIFRKIGLVEQEGIGVDRIMQSALDTGHKLPLFEEPVGRNTVRVTLFGGAPDEPWIQWQEQLNRRPDFQTLFALHILRTERYVTAARLATSIQDSVERAETVLESMATLTADGLLIVSGDGGADAERGHVLLMSQEMATAVGSPLDPIDRESKVMAYIDDAGRITSSQAALLIGTSVSTASALLKAMASGGMIIPSNSNGGGRGFHYLAKEK